MDKRLLGVPSVLVNDRDATTTRRLTKMAAQQFCRRRLRNAVVSADARSGGMGGGANAD
jgi:hypothetical protein